MKEYASRAEVLSSLAASIEHADRRSGFRVRNIYEAGGPYGSGCGEYFIDYATYPGGTLKPVQRALVDELEREGLIVRAFEDSPQINCWKLSEGHP